MPEQLETHTPSAKSGQSATADQLDGNIVALTHYLPPYMSCVLRHVAAQVRNFRVLLSVDQEPNRKFAATWDGLDVAVQKSLMLRRPWEHSSGFRDELYVHFPYDTFGRLKQLDPDIVFSYELGFRSLQSALYCRRHKKKLALCVCVSEHTEQGRGPMRSVLRKWLLRSADAVTYNGPSCLRYLQRFGVSQERLFHFPYATSDQFQYSGALERSSPTAHRLLCVGQLNERKGVLPLLDSLVNYCRMQPGRNVAIDFVGTGPLQNSIAGRELPDNLQLRLLGHLDYPALSQVMSESGVLVCPTLADEWGLVVNEAMQAGLPVLGSRYAQASTTLIRDQHNGWLYTPNAPHELPQRLDALFALSPAELQPLRQAAQETVRGITSHASAAKAIVMFRQLLTYNHVQSIRKA